MTRCLFQFFLPCLPTITVPDEGMFKWWLNSSGTTSISPVHLRTTCNNCCFSVLEARLSVVETRLHTANQTLAPTQSQPVYEISIIPRTRSLRFPASHFTFPIGFPTQQHTGRKINFGNWQLCTQKHEARDTSGHSQMKCIPEARVDDFESHLKLQFKAKGKYSKIIPIEGH